MKEEEKIEETEEEEEEKEEEKIPTIIAESVFTGLDWLQQLRLRKRKMKERLKKGLRSGKNTRR